MYLKLWTLSPPSTFNTFICRSESLTQALINRYDSDMEDDDEDKSLRISSLEKELVRQEQLVLDLKRRMNN